MHRTQPATPYAMTCSAAVAGTPRDPVDPRHRMHATPAPFYAVCKRPGADAEAAAVMQADHRRATTHTLIVAFFVLLCLFSCAMTVALLYQSHAETHRQIEKVISDLRSFNDVVRDELVAKRALFDDYKQLNRQRQQQQQLSRQLQNRDDELAAAAAAADADYEDLQLRSAGYADDDRFMGVDLDGNRRPSGARPRTAAVGGGAGPNVGTTVATDGGRRRRSAVIDVTKPAKNELNRSAPVDSSLAPFRLAKTLDGLHVVLKAIAKFSKKFEDALKTLAGSANEKSEVELIPVEEGHEGNKVPTTYNQPKPRSKSNEKRKGKSSLLVEPVENEGETYEDHKNQPLVAAAHFASDSSNYSTRTHNNYLGNGKLRHPNGSYTDWSQHVWNGNSNTNHFEFNKGAVTISTPGVYFVYAQLYYSDPHDVNGYFVMKNNEKVLACTTTRHQGSQSDSCYTAGLIYFNTNDVLSIQDTGENRYIILDPIRSFFGLFEVAKHFK